MNESTISLLSEDGKVRKYKIILTYEKVVNNNLYVVYTNNELDDDGFIITYAGIYQNTSDGEILVPVKDDEDWEFIEKLLKKVDKEELVWKIKKEL